MDDKIRQDLLRALKNVVAELEDAEEDRNQETGEIYPHVIEAKQAISQAEGEAPIKVDCLAPWKDLDDWITAHKHGSYTIETELQQALEENKDRVDALYQFIGNMESLADEVAGEIQEAYAWIDAIKKPVPGKQPCGCCGGRPVHQADTGRVMGMWVAGRYYDYDKGEEAPVCDECKKRVVPERS